MSTADHPASGGALTEVLPFQRPSASPATPAGEQGWCHVCADVRVIWSTGRCSCCGQQQGVKPGDQCTACGGEGVDDSGEHGVETCHGCRGTGRVSA